MNRLVLRNIMHGEAHNCSRFSLKLEYNCLMLTGPIVDLKKARRRFFLMAGRECGSKSLIELIIQTPGKELGEPQSIQSFVSPSEFRNYFPRHKRKLASEEALVRDVRRRHVFDY